MERKRKKHLKLLFILAVFSGTVFGQAKSGMESYNFLGNADESLWMPVVHYQSAKGLYAEFRYNYEDKRTASLYLGKAISLGKEKAVSVTPLLGVSTGYFSGISMAFNTVVDGDKLYISSQSQYSIATKKLQSSFFFSWSEAAYNISNNLFLGAAVQFTREEASNTFQPGILGGLNFGNLSLPVYLFHPFRKKQFVILGINYEYTLKKRGEKRGR